MKNLLWLSALIFCAPQLVDACPSCYGAADAPMTEGLNMALISLLGVTGGVLAGFVSFFLALRKRARQLVEPSKVTITE